MTTTRKAINDLLPGTDYAVRIRAIGQDGSTSEWSTKHTFTTIQDGKQPSKPTNVVWVSVGDAFYAQWDTVTTNVSGETIPITRYEVELDDGTVQKIQSVPQVTGAKVSYELSFEANKALFGTPQPSIGLRVRAVDNKELKSDWTDQIIAVNPPPNPVENAAAEAGIGFINLTWDAPSGPTDDDIIGYRVYVGSTPVFTPLPANMVYDGSATMFTYMTSDFTELYFIIHAVDKFLQESDDVVVNATAGSPFFPDLTAPPQPTDVVASITPNDDGSGATLTISWTMADPPSDLAGFYIRYRKVGDTVWSFANITRDEREVTIPLPEAYVDYEVEIKAYDWQNNESGWTALLVADGGDNVPPSDVAGFSADSGLDSITFTWTAIPDKDLKNYEITLSTSSTFASGNITFLNGTSTTMNVGGLFTATQYYARIRAVDKGGLTSNWSSTITATTGGVVLTDGYAPGSSPTPNVSGGLGYLFVTWTPVATNSHGDPQTDAVTYEVHLSTTNGFTPSSGTKVSEITGTATIIDILPGSTTPLAYNTNYYVRLVAKDRDGTAAAGAQAGPTQLSQVASGDVQSIGANLIVPGTGIINNLVINTGGSIASSNYVANTSGYKLDLTGLEINNGAVKVSALRTGTITSTSAGGPINLGAGSALVANGGAIVSNTYGGTTYNAAATAGFYIDDTHVHIPQGQISASALSIGGSITSGNIILAGINNTTGTIQTSGYNGTSGFRLSSQGLEIPNGSIDAAKLTARSGVNILPNDVSSSEYPALHYASSGSLTGFVTTNCNLNFATGTNSYIGTQSFYLTSTGASNMTFYLARGTTGSFANFMVEPSRSYILSGYVAKPSGTTAKNITIGITWFDDSGALLSSSDIGYTSVTWDAGAYQRISGVVTAPATAARAFVYINSTNFSSGGIMFDCLMLEGQQGTATAPSVWSPGTNVTTITGSMIKTGQLQSNAVVTVGSTNVPAWLISLDGSAAFANMQVRGASYVGSGSTDGLNSFIGSAQYTAGSTGWRIYSDGSADFQNVDVRGTVTSSAINGGIITGAEFHMVNTSTRVGVDIDSNGFTLKNFAGGTLMSTNLGYIKTFGTFWVNSNVIVDNGIGITAGGLTVNGGIDLQSGGLNMNSTSINNINDINGTGAIKFTFDSTFGKLKLSSAGNINGRIGMDPASAGTGTAITFRSNFVAATTDNMNNTTATASNTVTFHAADIHSWTGGIWMEDLVQASGTTATINANGRIVRTSSSERYKKYIHSMTMDEASKALDLRPVSYVWRTSMEMGDSRVPGFIAEEADAVGATMWVTYDTEGRPDGFRYGELTAAHNLLIKDLYEKIEQLTAEVAALKAT